MTFPGYTNQFTGSPIAVAYPQYLGLNVTSASGATPPDYSTPVQLYWAFAEPWQPTPFATNIQILTNDSTTNVIKLPDATMASTAQTTVIFNTSDTDILLQDFNAGTIGTIESTLFYYLTLVDNSTPAGTWILAQFAAGSAEVNVYSLVDTQLSTDPGNLPMNGGLLVVEDTTVAVPGPYLKSNMLVQNYDTASQPVTYTQSLADRASLLVVSATSGNLTYNLLSAASVGNGFLFSVNNASASSGSGQIIFIPNGTDEIDVTILNPGNSATYISDGVSKWTSLGFGLNTVPTSFNNVTIRLAGGSQAFPPLGFFNDTTQSAGLFYNLGTVSSQIVQSYPAGAYPTPGTAQVIANFTANSSYPNGQATLTLNSTFTPTMVNLNPSSSFNVNSPVVTVNATTSATITSPVVNLVTPVLEQEGLSIYTLMLAYT